MAGPEVEAGATGIVTLSAAEFREVSRLAQASFGLELRAGKEALVAARLGKRMRARQLASVREYLRLVEADTTGVELAELVDALTTNFTSFLREADHFHFLRREIAPQLERRAFTVWSAGCASGEEAYSILFTLAEALGAETAGGWQVKATDISGRVLRAAARGVYAEERCTDLPAEWLRKYFQRGRGEWAGQLRVKPHWRARIEFERLNLMEPFDGVPQCAAIFCRNVMIYFDKRTQAGLVQKFTARLEPGGYLMIGHSEGLMGIAHGLEYTGPAIYRRPGTLRQR
jgi:chemotaxis protein methyltransferase CheR